MRDSAGYQHIDKQGYTSTYTHNTVNQYTRLHTDFVFGFTADADISHDDNGNLSVDAAGYAYSYDHRNRLTEITDTAKFGYDALGRRISKYDEAADTTTYYYYNAFNQVIAEYEEPTGESAELARTFVYGNGIDEVLAMYLPERDYDPDDVDKLIDFCDTWLADSSDGNYNSDYDYDDSGVVDFNDFAVLADDSWSLPEVKETRFYYLHDALGSVIGLVGAHFQRESDREFYLYDVYGKPSETSACGNPYYYTGRRLDKESGLYYFRTRTYDPGTGRFLQTDPIEYIDGMNLYEYVGDNPVMFTDPFGLYSLVAPGSYGMRAVPLPETRSSKLAKSIEQTRNDLNAVNMAIANFGRMLKNDCPSCEQMSSQLNAIQSLYDQYYLQREDVFDKASDLMDNRLFWLSRYDRKQLDTAMGFGSIDGLSPSSDTLNQIGTSNRMQQSAGALGRRAAVACKTAQRTETALTLASAAGGVCVLGKQACSMGLKKGACYLGKQACAIAGTQLAVSCVINPIGEKLDDNWETHFRIGLAAVQVLMTYKVFTNSVTAPTNTKGWKVGDPINNLTKKGNVPSWSAVRQRYMTPAEFAQLCHEAGCVRPKRLLYKNEEVRGNTLLAIA